METTTPNTQNQPGTWNEAVLLCLGQHDGPVPLRTLYSDVEKAAPNLVAQNPTFWRDKARQVLQRLGRKGLALHAGKGLWAAKR